MNNKNYNKLIKGLLLVFCMILLTCFISGIIYSLRLSFSIAKKETIVYNEKSDIDYKVYLKDNDFYDEEYLNKGMVYVASLIDSIKINYNYAFDVNKESDLDFNYKVVAKLVIASQNNENVFFEKEYDLTDTMKDGIHGYKNYSTAVEVSIDYDYYNDLANKFRANYAVNTNSYLDVYLDISETNKTTNSYKLKNTSKADLIIPLSEQEISISLNNQNVNNQKQIVSERGFALASVRYLIISIVIFILIIITVISIVNMFISLFIKKKSEYERFINRILRCYDRIIVNVSSMPRVKNYNTIIVESIDELVDARDNVKEPINYCVIKENESSSFYVIHRKDLYLYNVKKEDFDEKGQAKKK